MLETYFNPKNDSHSPIIIVGAGLAGLATAVTLTKQLLSCKVFDKNNYIFHSNN
jgi:2-polyprenyl-6-methoxyphenol hydroxylase-like FAD-dependent oxidoreductase